MSVNQHAWPNRTISLLQSVWSRHFGHVRNVWRGGQAEGPGIIPPLYLARYIGAELYRTLWPDHFESAFYVPAVSASSLFAQIWGWICASGEWPLGSMTAVTVTALLRKALEHLRARYGSYLLHSRWLFQASCGQH